MGRRRVRIVRVRLAAWAVAAAACLGLPLSLAILREDEERPAASYVVQDLNTARTPVQPVETVEFEPPSRDGIQEIAELRAAGDVEGLLGVVERARRELLEQPGGVEVPLANSPGPNARPPSPGESAQLGREQAKHRQVATRRAMLAIASLCRVPGSEAEEALRTIAKSDVALTLERTTALAALWERGVREFVEDQGRDSDDPAIRSKVRVLRLVRPGSH